LSLQVARWAFSSLRTGISCAAIPENSDTRERIPTRPPSIIVPLQRCRSVNRGNYHEAPQFAQKALAQTDFPPSAHSAAGTVVLGEPIGAERLPNVDWQFFRFVVPAARVQLHHDQRHQQR